MRRPASDFREHRAYAPGDDIRYVDWKASARQEHVFIKQGEQQKAATIYLLLDCSGSMAWGAPPKSITALTLAHALGYLALAHSDRLVVLPVTGSLHQSPLTPLGPLSGKGQAPLLGSYFQAIRFQGQVDVTGALGGISRREFSRGGLVLVLSDLLGVADLSAGLKALPAPAWKVVFCHLLHPDEISPELNGHFELQDIETGQKKRNSITSRVLATYRQKLDAWRENLAQICLERNATYTLLQTNWSIENEIISQLRHARVVKIL
jgi:hypothetical protein